MRGRSLFIVLAGALALAGCASGTGGPAPGGVSQDDPARGAPAPRQIIRGSGNVVSESRDVRDFTKVDLAGSGELRIEQGDAESLTIKAEDNILPLITSEVSAGTLVLGLDKDPHAELIGIEPIVYSLTVEDLDGITLSGSGTVTLPDLSSPALLVAISGPGTITVGGAVATQDVEISGPGSYMAEGLESRTADVVISGPGSAVVRVSDTLDATISGVGSIEYIGDPTVTENITGVGLVTQR